MPRYQYPVANPYEAREVTEADFDQDIDLFDEGLYVNLDKVRGEQFRKKIFFTLGIKDERLAYANRDYLKIICSGHRGCGKTTELKRLHKDLNHADRYFSVFLSIEEEMEFGAFQPEDIFVWIILKLVEAIREYELETGTADFDDLARQLLSDRAIERELNTSAEGELETETGIGLPGFLSWLKLSTKAKAVFSTHNETSTKIREAVRRNTLDVIQRINQALATMRPALAAKGVGQDLLFVIDGSEKLRFEVYEYLFVQNSNLLRALAVNMIVAVPIDSYYKIEAASAMNFPHRFIVPMIKLAEPESEANRCFKEVIEKRIDVPVVLAPGVLDECVRRSGGCMRQLLIIVNTVIVEALGEQATLENAQTAIYALGSEMNQLLSNKHVAILQQEGPENLRPGEPEVREMLFQLVLLKYNGTMKLNPLLEQFITLA